MLMNPPPSPAGYSPFSMNRQAIQPLANPQSPGSMMSAGAVPPAGNTLSPGAAMTTGNVQSPASMMSPGSPPPGFQAAMSQGINPFNPTGAGMQSPGSMMSPGAMPGTGPQRSPGISPPNVPALLNTLGR